MSLLLLVLIILIVLSSSGWGYGYYMLRQGLAIPAENAEKAVFCRMK